MKFQIKGPCTELRDQILDYRNVYKTFLQTSEFNTRTFNLSSKHHVYNLFRTRSLRKSRFQEQQRPLTPPNRATHTIWDPIWCSKRPDL